MKNVRSFRVFSVFCGEKLSSFRLSPSLHSLRFAHFAEFTLSQAKCSVLRQGGSTQRTQSIVFSITMALLQNLVPDLLFRYFCDIITNMTLYEFKGKCFLGEYGNGNEED